MTSQEHSQSGPVCKTSIPGSNPGGASKFPRKVEHFAVPVVHRQPRIGPKRTQVRLATLGATLTTDWSAKVLLSSGRRDGGLLDLHPRSTGVPASSRSEAIQASLAHGVLYLKAIRG
jgi:hypothetical protein